MAKLKTADKALSELLSIMAGKTFKAADSPKGSNLPVNIATDGTTAELQIYRPIGEHYCDGVSGAFIAADIAWLSGIVDTIVIRLNSHGGSVLDGWSIIAAMQNSKAKIICIVDGLAASIASIIAVCANETYIVDYGLVMTHKTAFASGSGESELLETFNRSLETIYSKRLKLSVEDVKAKFLRDTDSWFDAEAAKKAGLVDHIIETQAKDLVNEAHAILALGTPAFESIVNLFTKTPETGMNKAILNALKLADGGDAEVLAAITNLSTVHAAALLAANTEITNKTAEVTALAAKVKAFEDAETARKSKEAEDLVNAAVKEGKISEESKKDWLSIAVQNIDAVRNSFAGMSAAPKLSTVINTTGTTATTKANPETPATFKPLTIEARMQEIASRNTKND